MLHHRTSWVVAIRNGLRLWRSSRNLSLKSTISPFFLSYSMCIFHTIVIILRISYHSRSNHSCSLQNSPHLHCSDLNSKIQSCNMSYCIHKLCPMNDGPRKHLTSFETWFITDLMQSVPH